MIAGNLLGAILTFFYFRVVDPDVAAAAGRVSVRDIGLSAMIFVTLVSVGYPLGRRWLSPFEALHGSGSDIPAAMSPLLRRRALQLPYVFACLSLSGWILAGVIWGVLWPTLGDRFNPGLSLRLFFGITGIAGSVATVFSFLVVEHRWRRAMPLLFPRGDVSDVPGAPRLAVRLRLLGIFLVISVIPLAVLGTLAYNRAQALLGADPARAAALVEGLGPLILFIVVVGVLAAIGLAIFAAHSVAAPLRRVEEALLAMSNVVLTPHLGSAVAETREAIANVVVDNIAAVIEGRPPPNCWNPEIYQTPARH